MTYDIKIIIFLVMAVDVRPLLKNDMGKTTHSLQYVFKFSYLFQTRQ